MAHPPVDIARCDGGLWSDRVDGPEIRGNSQPAKSRGGDPDESAGVRVFVERSSSQPDGDQQDYQLHVGRAGGLHDRGQGHNSRYRRTTLVSSF